MAALPAVTYNLGCGGPHNAARVEAGHAWSIGARERYDLVFAQEIPWDAWLDAWRPTHHVISVAKPRYLVRSALMVGNALKCSSADFSTAHYHDSYVAAATVTFPNNQDVTCASVHASPSVVIDDWRRLWGECGEPFPTAREGVDLWDSDLLLASIAKLSVGRSLLVAGDWNEAASVG